MLARLGQRLSRLDTKAWWLAVIVYICVQGSLQFQIAQARNQPADIDDMFTYIWQAAHLDVCRHSCPALETLIPIVQTPSDDIKLHNLRVDKTSRLLTVYAPLEEGLLLLIQRVTGLEWADAYSIFVALGVVLQAVGIGLLLRALWGSWPASLGLVTAAFTAYKGQGLVYVIPSNVTLTLAMIVWAYLIKDGRNASRIFIIGVLALVASHPIGRLYSLVALGLYLLSGHWWLTRREWGVVVVVVLIIAGYWLFAGISTAPRIDMRLGYVNPDFPTYTDLVRYQLVDALHKIDESLQGFTLLPYILLDALFLIGAFLLIPRPGRRIAGAFFALALGMLMAAAFTSLVAYPGEGNRRVILVFQIAIAGGLGTLMIWSLGRLCVLMANRFQRRNRARIAEFILVIIVATVSCSTWIMTIVSSVVNRAAAVQLLANAEDYKLNRDDLASLFSQTDATILYTNEIAMLYGLSNGLHRFGAIYLHILDTPVDLTPVDYILGLQGNSISDPLGELKMLFPDHFIEEDFILVDGFKSDLRLYARRP